MPRSGAGVAVERARHGRGRFADAATGDVYDGHWRIDQRAGRGTTLLKEGEAEAEQAHYANHDAHVQLAAIAVLAHF